MLLLLVVVLVVVLCNFINYEGQRTSYRDIRIIDHFKRFHNFRKLFISEEEMEDRTRNGLKLARNGE